jgi:4'-phosphopantetheinyl transferase
MIICLYTEINCQWNEQEFADKLALLPQKLQQQVLRKWQWKDRQLFIAGKLLLLRVMKELSCQSKLTDLQYNAYDRPYFDNGPDFNITHSGNIVICCGIDIGMIGIDIEQVKEIELADYNDYFTPAEWEKVKHHGFYDFWTRKEAVLKAIGTGFHTSLSSIDVSADSLTYKDITYYLRPLIIDQDYKCYIATTLASANIQITRVDL